MRLLAFAFALLCSMGSAYAAGTVPLAAVQQQDVNGKPLAGCLLYVYQANTVSTPQQPYNDFGLTSPASNPLQCDQTGRIPMFWLADGLIHVRLTDSGGVVQFDITMQTIGPSSGGGGGGGGVDPTSVLATGDIKFRSTSEILTGFVRLNGLTVGSSTSGATERANADTQNLYVYLWTNCAQPTSNNRCPVSGGLGASALADFSANKAITLPDWRSRGPVGRDCMGNACSGRLLAGNIGSGGSDGVDTGGAFGGSNNTAIAQANLPNVNFTISGITLNDPGHTHTYTAANASGFQSGTSGGNLSTTSPGSITGSSTTGITVSNQGVAASGGAGTLFPNIHSFEVGTWYMKL